MATDYGDILITSNFSNGITNENCKQFTQFDRLKELDKCKNDPIYFIENYVVLELPGELRYMKLYEPQKDFILSLLHDHHTIALKSRQVGISTCTQAFICWAQTCYENVVSGVVSRDGDESTDFCRRVMSMLNHLPVWLKPRYEKESERTFVLNNGCKFYASQVSTINPSKLFRGKPVTIAVIDEAAFIDKIAEGFVGFAPSLFKSQTTARQNGVPFATVVISTPNRTTGRGKWFYDKWVQAQQPDSTYTPHKIHWSQIKDFTDDPNWYSQQCNLLNNDKYAIDQELELKFVASSNSFFDPDTISLLNDVKDGKHNKILLNNKPLKLWANPNANVFYIIGVDTASPSGADFQTVVIFDYVKNIQVGEYRCKTRVDEFCKAVEMIVRIFTNSIIVVENNSYGNQVVEYLTRNNISTNIYKQKLQRDIESDIHYRYGISTNHKTRPLIIDALYTNVKEDVSMIKSQSLALELIGLEKKNNGKVEAGVGMNDDLALATAFCMYVRQYDPPMNIDGTGMSENDFDEFSNIVDMNFSDFSSGSLATYKYSNKKLSNDMLNKSTNAFIRRNLDKLLEGNKQVVDVSKLFSMDNF